MKQPAIDGADDEMPAAPDVADAADVQEDVSSFSLQTLDVQPGYQLQPVFSMLGRAFSPMQSGTTMPILYGFERMRPKLSRCASASR